MSDMMKLQNESLYDQMGQYQVDHMMNQDQRYGGASYSGH